MKKNITLSLVVIIFILWCASEDTIQANDFLEEGISVSGHVIYCKGKPFAELRYFDTGMSEILTEETWVDGIAIYNYFTDKEVWIYPEQGFSISQDGSVYTKIADMKLVYGKFKSEHLLYTNNQGKYPDKWASVYIGGRLWSKEEFLRRVHGVKISADGLHINYKVHGMFFDSSHQYLIDKGCPNK